MAEDIADDLVTLLSGEYEIRDGKFRAMRDWVLRVRLGHAEGRERPEVIHWHWSRVQYPKPTRPTVVYGRGVRPICQEFHYFNSNRSRI
jgi:hypothetical protein